jgi:uncharacterized Zn-binding protein involved in type VI secretion
MVQSGGLAQARATDPCVCSGSGLINFIVTGAGQVLIDGLPAARMNDKTMHPPPGMIVLGEVSVLIGGPTVGATLGGGAAAKKACTDVASGRTSGSTQQSYQNCGVESCRQIINQANGSAVGEDQLLDQSFASGNADNKPLRKDAGGTSPDQRQQILAQNGVASTQQPNSMDNIMQGVAEKKGVITSHDAGRLWGPPNTGGHALLVTGVEYDANGNPTNVITNDTGKGVCGRVVPIATFTNSLRRGRAVNVTNNPIY